jgi:hypothetical protein
MKRLLPVIARVGAKLFGNPPISACASEVIELAPAVDRFHAAAIALPGEFDRVVGVGADTTIAIELGRLNGGQRQHGPTIAYQIDNAVLGDGTLYFSGGYQVIRGRSSAPLLTRHRDNFEEMQLCTNYYIDRYFGHWLTDGAVLELLAAERALPAIRLAGAPWLHEPGYREIVNLEVKRSRHAHIDRLWIIDDSGINDSWISRIEELRRRVRSAAVPNGPKRVMLTRGKLGAKRDLINHSEVEKALTDLGFVIVHPETETARDLVDKLSAAEIAITVEGSHLTHCWLAMPRQSTFAAIQPPTRFNAWGKLTADAIGINFAYVVADPHPEGFYLPIDRLLRTIDEVVRATAAQS